MCGINGCKKAFRQRAKLCNHRKTHKDEDLVTEAQTPMSNMKLNEEIDNNTFSSKSPPVIMSAPEVPTLSETYCLCNLNQLATLLQTIPITNTDVINRKLEVFACMHS